MYVVEAYVVLHASLFSIAVLPSSIIDSSVPRPYRVATRVHEVTTQDTGGPESGSKPVAGAVRG